MSGGPRLPDELSRSRSFPNQEIAPFVDMAMPSTFPAAEFRAFGLAATRFFPEYPTPNGPAVFDRHANRRHFEWSWRAVRYRYRGCTECEVEFRALIANADEGWRAGLRDEELTYKLERCIYTFFMSALSIFDSFAFCLYFLGHAVRPVSFPGAAKPRAITRIATTKAYRAAFPQATVTRLLAALASDAAFRTIEDVRNLVGPRISGRRSVRVSDTTHADGTYLEDWREDTWALPGAPGALAFGEDMLQRHLDDVTRWLAALSSAAREFAERPEFR
jgi:hypothetical protein